MADIAREMDRLRGLLRALPTPAASERESFTDFKSTCPYCHQEIDADDFNSHMNVCFPSASEDSFELRPSPAPEVDWNLYNNSSESYPSIDRSSDEEEREEQLTITSRFLSPSQSIRSDSGYSDSEESEAKTEPEVETVLCPVCFGGYCRPKRVPILLPECGHTLCLHCVKRIYRENALVKCPVCRVEYYDALGSFPINVAILELTEEQKESKLCSEHSSEIIAFCEDHGKLLCGLCAFEHKDHASFLLHSPQAQLYLARTKADLQALEASLEAAKSAWEDTTNTLELLSRSVVCSLHTHSSNLQMTEIRLLEHIRSGKRACLDQLKSIMEEKGPERLQASCATQMLRIAQDLQRLHENRIKFDRLSASEQLTTALAFRPENYSKPPSLDGIQALAEQLNNPIDYETAIKTARLITIEMP